MEETSLAGVIKSLEDKGLIQLAFIHRNWVSGAVELNIEFKDSRVAEKILKDNGVNEIESSAFWE